MIAKSRALLMLLAIIGLAHSQTPNEVRINPQQPTVYLTPERLTGDKLWLRLHNNSRWAISFRTEQPVEITVPFRLADGREVKALIEGAEISPKYVIDNPMIGGSSVNSCSSFEQWLTPGTSALMPVPVERLKPLAYFYVNFRYEWGGDGHEPEHRVRFEYYPETKVPGNN
ncbi:MAG TPA: hypothetical protein VHQ64_07340 [Pyrinomonadaceae bacterium]|jgi:hypothetical protein|nr:hypothetical protein [Pyrinomonadaceae bacterium]